MTRIIAGRAGSLALTVPPAGTRPTSDRVRESLFGALEAAGLIEDAAVLDLFAGSGALGLEALSRGAASVDLVERGPKAAVIAERNLRAVAAALGGATGTTHRAAVETYLRTVPGPFDLVFLDPPYELGETELTIALGLLVPSLAPEAVVVIERATRSGRPTLPDGLSHDRDKRYGDTTIWWASAV